MSSKESPRKGVDLIARGRYGADLLGSATFTDNGWLISIFSKLSITTAPVSALPTHTLFRFSLPLPHWIILSLSATAAVKQIFWLLYTSKEELSPASAVAVGVFNAVSNSISSAFFVAAGTPGHYGISTEA